MTWLLIGFILCLIIAPIFMLLPSPRQKELMAFRNEAKSRGISIELCSIDDPTSNPDRYLSATGKPLERVIKGIAYRVARKQPLHWRKSPPINWKVIQTLDARWVDLPRGWIWDESEQDLPEKLRQALTEELNRLPVDVIVVAETEYIVSVYWREKGGTDALEGVCSFLEKLALISTPPV